MKALFDFGVQSVREPLNRPRIGLVEVAPGDVPGLLPLGVLLYPEIPPRDRAKVEPDARQEPERAVFESEKEVHAGAFLLSGLTRMNPGYPASKCWPGSKVCPTYSGSPQ